MHEAPAETLTITASNGVRFLARILREGDAYGLNGTLPWVSETPGVEFYDTRYPHTPFGQFVARYHADTLLHVESALRHAAFGLDLHGGVEDWSIDAAAMVVVLDWLRHETA